MIKLYWISFRRLIWEKGVVQCMCVTLGWKEGEIWVWHFYDRCQERCSDTLLEKLPALSLSGLLKLFLFNLSCIASNEDKKGHLCLWTLKRKSMADQGPRICKNGLWNINFSISSLGSLDLCNGQQQTHCPSGGCCFHEELIFYCCDLAPSCGHFEFSQLK